MNDPPSSHYRIERGPYISRDRCVSCPLLLFYDMNQPLFPSARSVTSREAGRAVMKFIWESHPLSFLPGGRFCQIQNSWLTIFFFPCFERIVRSLLAQKACVEISARGLLGVPLCGCTGTLAWLCRPSALPAGRPLERCWAAHPPACSPPAFLVGRAWEPPSAVGGPPRELRGLGGARPGSRAHLRPQIRPACTLPRHPAGLCRHLGSVGELLGTTSWMLQTETPSAEV